MKITFIEPPSLHPKKNPERLFGCSYELYHFLDLANLYLLTLLDQKGFSVDYLDAILDKLNWKNFLQRLKTDDSKIYIIHSVILSKKTDLFTMKKLRKYNPHSLILVHGPEPTRVPQEYLIDENVIIFRGEPEENLIRFLQKNQPRAISYFKKGQMVEIPSTGKLLDLDTLPPINRLHPAIRDYVFAYTNPKLIKRPQTIMMTSRGCAFRCRFCVPNSISFAREIEYLKDSPSKPKPALLSAERVIAEFQLIKKQGFKAVMVVDDQFLWDKKRTLKICAGIKKLKLEWACLSRADFLTDKDVVKAIAESGCHLVDIGVESLDQKVLNYIRKDLKISDIEKALHNLNTYGLEAKFNIMFGTCPFETPQMTKATVRKLQKMKIKNAMFSIATPFPGTAYYQTCKKKGYLKIDTENLDPAHNALISYPSFSKKELEDLQKWAYRSFYLRPSFLKNRLKTYKNPMNFIRDLKIISKLLI